MESGQDNDGLEIMEDSRTTKKKLPPASQANAYTSLSITDVRQPELLQSNSSDHEDEDERTSASSESNVSIDMVHHKHLSAEYGESNKLKRNKKHHRTSKDNESHQKNETLGPPKNTGTFSLGCIQLCAMIRKNLLSRCRSPLATILEILIPVLLLLIIVYEYKLADSEDYPGRSYHIFHLPMDGPWIDVCLKAFQNMHSKPNAGHRERTRLLLQDELFSLNSHMPDDVAPASLEDLFQQQSQFLNSFFNHRHLQEENYTVEEEDFDQADNLFFKVKNQRSNDIWHEAANAIRIMMKNPLPVPTLEEYLKGSDMLSSSLSFKGMNPLLLHSYFLQAWGNLLTLGTLHLSPADSPAALQFEQYIHHTIKSSSSLNHTNAIKVQRHADEATAVRYIEEHNFDERLFALIDFSQWPDHLPIDAPDIDGIPQHVKYKIRMNQTTLPNTDEIVDYLSIGLNQEYQKYYLSGYLTLQRTLNDFAFDYFNLTSTCNVAKENKNVWSMPMPTARYTQNQFFLKMGEFLGAAMVLGFLFPVSFLIKSMVEEKESRMRETLFILGIQPWAHWISWLISAMLPFLVIAVTVTSILAANILKFSNPFLLFSLIGLFLLSTIGFCFCIAALFSNAKISSIVGPMAFFATILPRFLFFGSNQYEDSTGKMLASLFPATAFSFGCDIVSGFEYSEQGVQEWNRSQGDYSFDTSLAMLIFDSLLFIFMGWYFDQVIPREYGTPRPLWFLVSPSYWCGSWFCCAHNSKSTRDQFPSYSDIDVEDSSTDDHECMADPSLVPQIKIRNLTKRYDGRKNKDLPPAVDRLHLDLYESQITTLLGHNGAGKTTAISLLTGLFPPTSGDASIYGRSIVDETAQARRSIGICSQQNILFGSLTVLEHVIFFNRIKGVHCTEAQAKVHADEIGLGEFLYTTSSALSGGNKRKLSVAVALCGDPKFLVLDEPTCGMDPCARRSVWELLRRKRLGRTILLSTHFMDEAELLSDRIAILRTGTLLCSGSPLFLKNRHGLGYNFTAVMEMPSKSTITTVESPAENLLSCICRYVPEAEISRIGGKEVTIRIPPGYEDAFPACFDELEKERENMKLGAFGIQNASLEEVFISLAQDHDDVKDPSYSSSKSGKENPESSQLTEKHNSANDTIEQESLVGGDYGEGDGWENKYMSPIQQIFLLYRKRVTIQKRDPGGLFVLLVAPVIVIALTLFVLKTPVHGPGKAIDLSLNLYQSSNTGGVALTDVLVGGGNASGLNSTDLATSISPMYKHFRHSVEEQYRHVQVQRVEKNLSSADVSKNLYQSINNHDHNMRYGAFVFNDTVRMEISINWPELFDQLEAFLPKLDDDLGPWSIQFPLGELSTLIDFGSLSKPRNQKPDSVHVKKKPDSAVSSGVKKKKKSSMDSIDMVNSTSGLYNATSVDQNNSTVSIFLHSNATIEKMNFTSDPKKPMIEDAVVETNSVVDHSYSIVVDDINETTKSVNSTSDPNETMDRSNETNATVETNFVVEQSNSTVSVVDHSKETDSAMGPSNATDSGMDTGPVLRLLAKKNPPKADKHKKSNLAPGLLSGVLNDKPAAPGFGFEGGTTGVNSGLMSSLGGTAGVNSALMSSLLGSQSGSFMDPKDLINENTMVNSGLMLSLGGTAGVNSALMSSLLGSQSGSFMDPKDLINENTMVKLTFYPSDSIVNIEPMLNLPPLFALLLAGQSLSRNMTLAELREKAPHKTENYLRYLPSNVSILHNTSSPHAVAAFNQAFSEFLFKECTGKSNVRLISENHPLPLSNQQTTKIKVWLSIVAVLFVLIPLCFIPGGFVVFLVKEKSCKAKHLQLVSGVNLTSYWIASYLYDITLYFALTVLIMAIFILYGKDAAEVFVGDRDAFLCTFTLTFGYGISVLPYSYLMARRFENHSAAQIAVAAFIFATGYVPYFMTFIGPAFKGIAAHLQPLFRCWPPFLIGEGLAMMAKAFWVKGMLGSNISPFDWDFAGKTICLLYSLAIPYFMLLLALEYSQDGGAGGSLGRLLRFACDSWEKLLLRIHGVKNINGTLMLDDGLVDDKEDLDDDVLAEEKRVSENILVFKQTAPILYHNLWKVYPPSVGLFGSIVASLGQFLRRIRCCCKKGLNSKEQRRAYLPKRAVRGVSVAVEEGETYALLGANGAGKTSTLGVLTGDVSATSGQVYVAGHDATGNEERNGVTLARRHIGFCPQVDPLLDLMTARETLQMYGRLRGISYRYIDGKVESLLEQLSLTVHAEKPSQNLSGGNKRKLSLGIALIGDPKVLLIDESSSGMDPLSKRRMWNLITKVSKNKTVIATTHSMEEAEALCTRAGIMAKGQLLCLGSVQHLKTKYLDGYTIDVYCNSGKAEEEIDMVVNEMLETALPGCKLAERYGRFLRFDVPSLSSLGLGTTFCHMQALKTSPLFCVENYSISQCSLEQVFVKLVEQVTTGTGKKVSATLSGELDSDIDEDDEEDPFLS